MTLRGVVFDMDGVLIDSHPAHLHAWRAFLSGVGREASNDELQFVLDGRKRQDILKHFLGELSEEQFFRYSEQKDKCFSEFADRVKVFPGVVELLDALEAASMSMAVATSASRSRAIEMLDRFKLSERFAAIVTGSDVERGKPNPEVYDLAAERLMLSPSDLVAVDDAAAGIMAARTAGMHCIGIATDGRAEALRRAGAKTVRADFVGMKLSDLVSVCGPSSSGE